MAITNTLQDSYIDIPTTLLLDHSVSSDAIRVYAGIMKIHELNDIKGGSSVPIHPEEIKVFCGMSTDHLRRFVSELSENGYVTVTKPTEDDSLVIVLHAEMCVFDPSEREYLVGTTYVSDGLSSHDIGLYDEDKLENLCKGGTYS